MKLLLEQFDETIQVDGRISGVREITKVDVLTGKYEKIANWSFLTGFILLIAAFVRLSSLVALFGIIFLLVLVYSQAININQRSKKK